MAKTSKTPAEEAFLVTIGVSHAHTDADCRRALAALARAGFAAGPTSDDAILIAAEQAKLTQALAENDE